MKQKFILNNGIVVERDVLIQKSKRFDSMTIQISQLPYAIVRGIKQFKYIYEEIDNKTDSIIYSRFMGENNIKENYNWFFDSSKGGD